MDNQTIPSGRRPYPLSPTQTPARSGLPETSAHFTALASAATPGHEARTLAATECVHEIARRVRTQMLERLAFPWRFEAYPLTDLVEAPRDTALEDLAWELDQQYRAGLEDP